MNTLKYTIQFHSYWHCGSGLASGADSDALVIKDENNMPYIPGKTLKGLIKEAAELLISLKAESDDKKNLQEAFKSVFGEVNKDNITVPGNAFFSSATLKEDEYNEIVENALQPQMYSKIASTAIDEKGIANPHSLRSMEVAIPCTLHATIKYGNTELEDILIKSIQLVKRIGVDRNRGLGRCTCTEQQNTENQNTTTEATDTSNTTNKRQYKCTLLSDIILSEKSATEGNVTTLDFIPGSNFLGIVARHYDEIKAKDKDNDNAFTIFHSGKIRFSDAHAGVDRKRSLHVPASLYLPKLQKEPYYVHHHIQHDNDEISALQLKQERKGFYIFGENEEKPQIINTQSTFAIKSAYDAKTRRSKDGQMFGYASLNKGLEMYFEVEADDSSKDLLDEIEGKLNGEHHIGKSRSAQYGLVKIEPCNYTETGSTEGTFKSSGKTYATVYADSRLIFLDKYGIPTFTPTAQDLGFGEGAIIAWEHSQVRTFDYAPWNGKRKCFDTNRCGIEKGSVFVVELEDTKTPSPSKSQYVGCYKNEGFGKVIYNPYFLKHKDGNNKDKAFITLIKESNIEFNTPDNPNPTTDLGKILKNMRDQERTTSHIYQIVGEWINNNASAFANEQFAAQWGAIRNLAIAYNNYKELKKEIEIFLGHGVAKDKWDKKGRKDKLLDFLNNLDEEIPDDKKYQAVINLASEMQKKQSTN